jgi:hypothetical protein
MKSVDIIGAVLTIAGDRRQGIISDQVIDLTSRRK